MYDEKYYSKYRWVERGGRGGRVNFTLKNAEIIDNHESLIILDIGCGIGTYSIEAMKRGHHIIGLEISKEALKCIYEKEINLILSSGHYLPFKSNIFDRILLIDVFEHIREPYKLLLNINRTLKVKGIFMLQVPNKKSIITSILYDPTHINQCNSQEIIDFLTSTKFKDIKIILTSFIQRLYPFSLILRYFFKSLIVAIARKNN